MNVKEKIQKLMAKAMSSGVTDAEAESFMNKARELMDRYGFSEADLAGAAADESNWRNYDNVARETKHGFAWHPVDKLCCRVVADFCGVVVYRDVSGDAPILRFYGLEQEVELCNWILHTLKEKFDRDWSNFLYIERKRKSLRAIPSQRASFSMAFAKEIARRLDGWTKKAEGGKSNALVVQKQSLARQKLADQGITLQAGRSGGSGKMQYNGEAAGAGMASAQSASLGRGVQNRTLSIGSA